MTRDQLEHLIGAAAGIADDDTIVVIGSQAVLGQFPDAPEPMRVSEEADLFPLHHPERADLIEGSIGELSPFHQTFGYYAQGVTEETAVLPEGWKDRLVEIRNENTRGAKGLCLEIIIGTNRDYIDWLPYTRTAARADLFFRGGRPFSRLSDGDRSQLKMCAIVRNVIAHRSRFSLQEFEKKVIGNTPLPPRERRPAGYLRGFGSAAPPRTRFESLLGTMLRVARILAA